MWPREHTHEELPLIMWYLEPFTSLPQAWWHILFILCFDKLHRNDQPGKVSDTFHVMQLLFIRPQSGSSKNPQWEFPLQVQLTENFIQRWRTHYIKSAKFGGQLEIRKTKQADQKQTKSQLTVRRENGDGIQKSFRKRWSKIQQGRWISTTRTNQNNFYLDSCSRWKSRYCIHSFRCLFANF